MQPIRLHRLIFYASIISSILVATASFEIYYINESVMILYLKFEHDEKLKLSVLIVPLGMHKVTKNTRELTIEYNVI